MTLEDVIELLVNKSGCSFFTKGYFFCTTFAESKIRMNILREVADAMTKQLVSVSDDKLQEGRFVFWGSTYKKFIYLLYMKYDEVEMFLDFISEKNNNLDNFQVARLFIKIEEKRIEVEFDIKNEKLLPLEVLVRDYFKTSGSEIGLVESE